MLATLEAAPPTRLLLVEDNPADADLVQEALDDAEASSPLKLERSIAGRLDHACRVIAGGGIDVVLLDLTLPDSAGLETLRRICGADPNISIVVLSGLQDEALAERAVHEGAQDYLVKGQVDGSILVRSIRYALERKRAEQTRARQLQVEAELRARDDLLATISHDLKSPLTVIKGYSQMLKRDALELRSAKAPRLVDGLERIEEKTIQMTQLIDELLDLTRLQARRPLELVREPTDLVALVRRLAAEHQDDLHQICVQAAPDELVGQWDGPRIERVLANLVINALKYSPGGGEVRIRLTREAGWVAISVQDEGIGIPAAELPRVFERFYRASNVIDQIRGSGIGLAGARQIVEQHGGSIGVQSQEGQGATFTVRLPVEPLA